MSGIEEQLAKLEREHNSLVAIVVGDPIDRDGGLKAEVKEHDSRLKGLENNLKAEVAKVQRYIDVGRKNDCLGLKELQRRDALEGEETEVTVAKINMKAYIIAAMIPSTITAILMVVQMLFKVGSTQ